MNFDIINNPIFFFIAVITVIYLVSESIDSKKPIDKQTTKRLKNVKEKNFEDDNNEEEDKLSFIERFKQLSQDTDQKSNFIRNLLNSFNLTSKIEVLLKVAGVKLNIDVFVVIPIVILGGFAILAILLKDAANLLVMLGVLFAIAPFGIVMFKKAQRLKNFTKQFPDALDLMASSLRAGHSMMASFQMVVDEMPSPISIIFKVAVDDIQLGIDTKDALNQMSTYMPDSIDLSFFVTAVLIQREIGGNLAEVLDSLNYTIRERFKLIGQLEAQTSQAKMSGTVLGCAPIAIGLLINTMNPTYMKPLLTTLIGHIIIGMAITSMIVGFIIIKKITDIRI